MKNILILLITALIFLLIFGCTTTEENEYTNEEIKLEFENNYAIGVISCANYIIPRTAGVKYGETGEEKKLVDDYLACTNLGKYILGGKKFISDSNFSIYQEENAYINHSKMMNGEIKTKDQEEYIKKLHETFFACQIVVCYSDPSECEYIDKNLYELPWQPQGLTNLEVCWHNYYQLRDGNFEFETYETMYPKIVDMLENPLPEIETPNYKIGYN